MPLLSPRRVCQCLTMLLVPAPLMGCSLYTAFRAASRWGWLGAVQKGPHHRSPCPLLDDQDLQDLMHCSRQFPYLVIDSARGAAMCHVSSSHLCRVFVFSLCLSDLTHIASQCSYSCNFGVGMLMSCLIWCRATCCSQKPGGVWMR